MRLAEPDPERVERAIVKVLEIAQLQGIVSFHLKSNMLSDYTRTLENEILPCTAQTKRV
jgi:hypothetical protein